MHTLDAATTTPAQATSAFAAAIDPWLRMRFAPAREHRQALDSAAGHDALRAIASARPDPGALRNELRPARALLDRQRRLFQHRLAEGGSIDEVARARAWLLDATVIGLCQLGRRFEAASAGMAAPLAAIARGDYGQRQLAPGASADLLLLVWADPARLERGLAVARLVARGLEDLGWPVSVATRTVRGCRAETRLDPAIASDLAVARLIWGARDLFGELHAGLTQRMSNHAFTCAVPGLVAS